MGFWEIFDTQFQHFARLNLQVLNILTDRQNDGMVSAVFYKIYPTLDLGLCIYIKWLFNQIPSDSRKYKIESEEKTEKHCIGRIGEPCQFVRRRWDHVTNTKYIFSGSGPGSELTGREWALSMNETQH